MTLPEVQVKLKDFLTAKHWSTINCAASERNFYTFLPIRTRSCKLIFNEDDATRKDWCEYWTVEKYLKESIPFDNALSICCGFGEVERNLARLNVAKRITGIDIAQSAVEYARKRAEADGLSGLEYSVANVNTEEIGENTYDLIWANGALHHIEELEMVIQRLYRGIRPGGYLVSNEYVGPRYQQVGKRQLEVINAIRHLLPVELRGGAIDAKGSLKTGTVRFLNRLWTQGLFRSNYGRLWRPYPVWYHLVKDPSECVHSDLIIQTLQKVFDEVNIRYFAGPILYYALDENFYNNFNTANCRHQKILNMLFEIEDTLIENGELQPDNAHIICRKK
jgi:ubiquinone/menaquinone biosynthesis C-methylase UbiE